MKLRKSDLIRLAAGALSANRLRTFLTILGVTIGVFSVVAVMTALSAARRSIDSGLSQLGSDVFQISRFPAIMINDGWWNYRSRPTITPREGARFKELMEETPGVRVTLHSSDGREEARYGDRKTGRILEMIGANENYVITNGYEIEVGRNISVTDLEFNRMVVVIGQTVVEKLFPSEDPIGKEVDADGRRFTVVGVLKERGERFGNDLDNKFIIPLPRFIETNWGRWRSMDIAVMAPSNELFDETLDQAIGVMRLVRGLRPEEPNNFEVYSNDSLRESFAQLATIVGAAGLIISGIALLAAGVGIMNIMLVSVTERTREIGIRKSIGARSRDVLAQFLLEALVLSELGCLFGILLGVVCGNVVAHFMPFEASLLFPWFWAGVAVLVCSFIGIGFGLYPAWRAANLHPVDALRYE